MGIHQGEQRETMRGAVSRKCFDGAFVESFDFVLNRDLAPIDHPGG